VVKPHDVMLEALHSRWFHVPELKLDPSIIVEIAFTMDTPGLQSLRRLDAHCARNPVRTPSPNLQLALGDETGEHLPQGRPPDAKFFHERAFRGKFVTGGVLA
jgi:hypothetical protein